MRLKIGNVIRPNNEAVTAISYAPVWNQARRMVAVRERWDTTGRIVSQATRNEQAVMTASLNQVLADIAQQFVDLMYLEDPPSNAETAMRLRVADCLEGPYIVDAGLPNQADDVYATGMGYRVIWEGLKPVGTIGNAILEFSETVQCEPGGATYTMVGGVVNYAERQLAWQNKPYRYTQSGFAVGLLAYPTIPPPLWPWALEQEAPKHNLMSPKSVGGIDMEYGISWEYRYAWHQPLYGQPHRTTF